ncbi:MAG: O-antigen ligase family protein [Asticcacaulis sp.]
MTEAAKRLEFPRYTAGVLVFILSLFLVFSYVGPLAFALTATLGGFLLLGHWRNVRHLGGLVLVLLAMLGWIGYRSTLMSDIGATGVIDLKSGTAEDWVLIAFQTLWYPALVLAAFDLKARHAGWLARWVAYGVLALSVWVLLDAISGAAIYQQLSEALYQPIRPDLAMVKLSIAAYALVLVFWPILLLTRVKHTYRTGIVTLLACVLVPLITGANAPVLALIVSVAVFYTARQAPYIGRISVYKIFAAIVAVFVLATPAVVHTGLLGAFKRFAPPSWDARIDIWQFAAERLFEKPLLGWGFNSSRTFGGENIPLHPHNMPIQVGLELGYVGVVILAVFWGYLILRIGRGGAEATGVNLRELQSLDSPAVAVEVDTRPYALATASAFFTIACLSFGIWQEWWLALGALATVVMIVVQKAVRPGDAVAN